MPRLPRLIWVGGGAVIAAAAVAAAIAWSGGGDELQAPARGPVAPGSAPGTDAATAAPPGPGAGSAAVVAGPAGRDAASSAADVDQAARLVASAHSDAAAGKLVSARSLLGRAYALDPRPATLLELADVEFQTGHCREARRAGQRVVADASGDLAARAQQLLDKIGRCD